ncbi:nucleoporin Pom152 [Pseudozyma hubeiensis SY62]|uniref:Nucleoporin Pom152 n=1 Tax=Pseudozyma hubeiensis (strain SY62) TaxID=1305764 RepID=R9PC02_PSEHS|nr:nucleoporin Pom152 [Pseudozyma hubeiensis SY62]GAC98859.1 nucleoporin Pom152 [Pseudozyma hubeiensis SY62]
MLREVLGCCCCCLEGPATAAATLGTDLMVDVWNDRVKAIEGLAERPVVVQEPSPLAFVPKPSPSRLRILFGCVLRLAPVDASDVQSRTALWSPCHVHDHVDLLRRKLLSRLSMLERSNAVTRMMTRFALDQIQIYKDMYLRLRRESSSAMRPISSSWVDCLAQERKL